MRRRCFEADEGPCANSPRHVFNLTASVETPQFDEHRRARARVGMATVGNLPRPVRTRAERDDRRRSRADGMQYQRVNQVVTIRTAPSRLTTGSTRRRSRNRRSARTARRGATRTPAWGPASLTWRSCGRSGLQQQADRSARRGVQRVQLVQAAAAGCEPEQQPVAGDEPCKPELRAAPRCGRSAHHAVRPQVFVLVSGLTRATKPQRRKPQSWTGRHDTKLTKNK